MSNKLFENFNKVTSKEWKSKIQYELDGADYNNTLIWESLEGIKVKPFYHVDLDSKTNPIPTKNSEFKILEEIYVYENEKSIFIALNSLAHGAEVLRFKIDNDSVKTIQLLEALPFKDLEIFISLNFLSLSYIEEINNWVEANQANVFITLDPIAQLCKEGNWFINLDQDIKITTNLLENTKKTSFLSVDSSIYQNSGANIIQQIAYTLSHLNEYLNRIPKVGRVIFIKIAVGTNYFFEIAKIRALRLLLNLLGKEFSEDIEFKIIARPTKRNKTLYENNVNMLRTTTECMSALLGGADYITNLSYDAIFRKKNDFSDSISRNQLLILKEESHFDQVSNPADGSYYIENLTSQLAEKALDLFKNIEKNRGFITQLIQGTIQRKIVENAEKEQKLFDNNKEILLGTNKHPSTEDQMLNDLELFPFVKKIPRKTLIVPIIEKRLAEKHEKQRLEEERTTKQ